MTRALPKTMASVMDRVRVDTASGCWVWVGPKSNTLPMLGHTNARDFVYQSEVGELIEGSKAYPLCGNVLCVSPEHLEQMPPKVAQSVRQRNGKYAEGLRSTSHCKRGHEYATSPVLITSSGRRQCLLCKKEIDHEKRVAASVAKGKNFLPKGPRIGLPLKLRTHCKNGHDLSVVGYYGDGVRAKNCKVCASIRNKAWTSPKKKAATP